MSGLGNTLAFVPDDVWGQRHSENNLAAQSWGILHQQIYRWNHLMTSPNNGTLPYQFITSGLCKEGRSGLCRIVTCRFKKKKKEYSKHEHQTSENTLSETNSRDSLCFSSLCFFFSCSVEDSVQTLITRRTDTLAVSTEYKAEAGLKKELSLLFQSTPLW